MSYKYPCVWFIFGRRLFGALFFASFLIKFVETPSEDKICGSIEDKNLWRLFWRLICGGFLLILCCWDYHQCVHAGNVILGVFGIMDGVRPLCIEQHCIL